MRITLLLFFTFCLSLTGFTQNERYGCHFFKNVHSHPKPKKLTQAQLKDLENSIARSDTFNIVKYTIELDVTDYQGQYIKGNTQVAFEALFPNRTNITFDLKSLTVDSVLYEGQTLSYSQFDDLLRVVFPEALTQNEEQTVQVFYQGIPYQDPTWGGFYHEQEYIYNLGIGLTTIPPNFGKVWYPCFDTFVERATYEYLITSANGMRAFCQGDLVEENLLEGDTIQRRFVFDHIIPTHLSAIAVANYQTDFSIHAGLEQDLDVTLTSKPSQAENMQASFSELPQAIDALEWWWGPYVWDRVGYVITTDGALEIPQNIAYPENMLTAGQLSNRRLLSHELGHHWWGDLTVMRSHNDMWMKEGPAEYSAHLVTEWIDGREAFIEEVKDNHLFVLETAHRADNGFQVLSPIIDEEIYGRHTYNKGASVMHNLRAYLGDSLYRSGLRSVLDTYPYDNITPQQMRDQLTASTGIDCAPFFDAWVFQAGFSDFVIDSVNTVYLPEGVYQHDVFIQQKLRAADNFHEAVPLEISAYNSDFSKFNVMREVSGQYSQVSFTTEFNPLYIGLNTNGILNQARMDYEYFVSEPSGVQNLPYVDFRVGVNNITDSALVRIEHHWVAPDDNNLAPYIEVISDAHYWEVDGVWSPELNLDARISYIANDELDLDWNISGQNENNMMLVWRDSPADPWINYYDYEMQSGNLFNGGGTVKIDLLRKGQYALAKGDLAAALAEQNTTLEVTIFPNPSSNRIQVKGAPLNARWNIVSVQGEKVMNGNVQDTVQSINIQGLAKGTYFLQIIQNETSSTHKFEVI
ncbi:MAG: T9SS type A sorting domain-containing protein [Flavobacteriales bacterium]|nr:T9SS type A sorting domain-containing protein [Flavobacteriales bacterium]